MILAAWWLALFLGAAGAGQTQPGKPQVLDLKARELIDRALEDKNPDVRKQAAMALSLGGPREPFLSKLDAMLGDKDVEARLAAVSSLADLGTARGKTALRKALDDEVPEVGFAAAKALYTLQDPEGKTALLAVLSGESKVASGFFSKQKRDAIRMMHTPKTLAWFAVKQGVGMAPVPGLGMGISSMHGILSDPNLSGRAVAVLLLGKERDPATLAALREALGDKDASVRAAAVHAVALQNNPAWARNLAPLMDDKKEAVRLRAAVGYLRLELVRAARGKGAAGGGK